MRKYKNSTVYAKINTIIVGTIMVIAFLLCSSSQVQAAQDGDYTYTVTAGKAQITKYTGAGGVVTIPSTLGGFPVTSIGYSAFYDNTGLTSISIPQEVTSIGDYAFRGCIGLTAISIPQGVTNIGKYAFARCTGLTSISIPQGVTSIAEGAFTNCTGLTSVSIPQGVTSIGDYTFYGCSNLTSISIPQGVTSLGSSTFYNCTGLTSISIPQGVTSIGDYTFRGCTGITTINIPQGVTSIGKYAFAVCSGLTSINIPLGVTSIAEGAFTECTGLTSVIIPQGVTSIGDYTFYGCSNLTSISIPQGVTSIGRSTFYNCTGLTSVSIPQGVTSIADFAFYGCSNLTSISLPQGVTSIGRSTFYNCTGLTTIRFDSATTTIYDAEMTVPAATKIIGYNPSTAKTYATKYNRTFEVIDVAITGISLNKNVTTISVGANETLLDTISPDNATDKSVTWSVYSQNGNNIATVSAMGLVTAVNPGTAVIRATSNADPTKYAECSVTVTSSIDFSATPIVKIGINPNYGDSAGIFIGLNDIRDAQGNLVPGAKLADYQIDLVYDHNQATVLDVVDEAQLGQFANNNGVNSDKTSVSDTVYQGTSNFETLFFVPLALTGTSKNTTNVTIKFISLSDTNSNHIRIPDVALTFQRGKIVNEASQQSLSIADAVAGLQYLAKIIDAGFAQGEVNVINMASILLPEAGATIIKPSVKDVIALMQKLVGLRDDNFMPLNQTSQGNDISNLGIAVKQDNRIFNITKQQEEITLSKSEFSMQFHLKNNIDYVHIASLADESTFNQEISNLSYNDVQFFNSGTAYAWYPDKPYDSLCISNYGQHIIFYENNEYRRADLINYNDDYLSLEWKINSITIIIDFRTKINYNIKDIPLNNLYLVLFTDNNLNGIIDIDEYAKIKINLQ